MKSEDILINCSAARITQTVRQCPTRTGPVARYVDLPINTHNKPILIHNIHLGATTKNEQVRAEPQHRVDK
jgi:hypothetical protein